jgi:hypothetical protein
MFNQFTSQSNKLKKSFSELVEFNSQLVGQSYQNQMELCSGLVKDSMELFQQMSKGAAGYEAASLYLQQTQEKLTESFEKNASIYKESQQLAMSLFDASKLGVAESVSSPTKAPEEKAKPTAKAAPKSTVAKTSSAAEKKPAAAKKAATPKTAETKKPVVKKAAPSKATAAKATAPNPAPSKPAEPTVKAAVKPVPTKPAAKATPASAPATKATKATTTATPKQTEIAEVAKPSVDTKK